MLNVETTIYPVEKAGDAFPEIQNERVSHVKESIAICTSGGGARAFSCSIGYFRALQSLAVGSGQGSVMNKAAYLSCVSGGTWASSVYIFSQESASTLTGTPASAPEDITPGYLAEVNGTMSSTVAVPNWAPVPYAIEHVFEIGSEVLWETCMGEFVLKPHGIDGKLFAEEDMISGICEKNSTFLEAKDFISPREKDGPFIIMSGSLQGPQQSSDAPATLQMTSIYTGSPYYPDQGPLTYEFTKCFCCKYSEKFVVGGGYIDSFSFGCNAPTDSNDQSGKGGAPYEAVCKLSGTDQSACFHLDKAIGISSAAFAYQVKNQSKLITDLIDPVETYWPILPEKNTMKGKTNATKYVCGDGGSFENTGLLATLQRGIRKVVVCINSGMALMDDPHYTKGEPISDDVHYMGHPNYKSDKLDDQFTGLFGVVNKETSTDGYQYKFNQVFAEDELPEVLKLMENSYNEGNGCCAYKEMILQDNPYWNIVGGDKVQVVFFYNENARNLREQLPSATKELITPGGKLQNYPHYSTYGVKVDDVPSLGLYQEQVNMLAATTEYVVLQNQDKVLQLFDDPQ